MRFLFNFIFFGLLFYIIHAYFPEVFQTLFDWVGKLYEFLHDLVTKLVQQVQKS